MKAINYRVGIYCRLSKDDAGEGESSSISTQKSILTDYCTANGFDIFKIYIDDGYSGLNFNRPGFQEMMTDVEAGHINMIVTKDLSRLGRDYIMTGYYLELIFPTKGIRYVALSDNYDSLKADNDIAPFKNILNDMYARDISKKVKGAKHQRARQGLFIGSQAPYGYRKSTDTPGCLIADSEAAETVKRIFSLAELGFGNIAIAAQLKAQQIVTPAVYKYRHGDTRFSRYPAVAKGDEYDWCATTVGQILNDPVYIGDLVSLKTEVTNCKTKQRISVPSESRIVTTAAHEAIISKEQFEAVKEVRRNHRCPANYRRFNLFRGLIYCSECGHPLAISRKQLLDRATDIYLCTYHYKYPEVCSKTHRVYHEVLYPYVLQQIQALGKSMKRRKVNSPIAAYADIEELTQEVLKNTIERIEIGHFNYKTRPGQGITIFWKVH